MSAERPYLRADAVITAVQQRADVSEVSADRVYRRAVFDVHVDEGGDESAGQLASRNDHVLKTHGLHLILKLLRVEENQ